MKEFNENIISKLKRLEENSAEKSSIDKDYYLEQFKKFESELSLDKLLLRASSYGFVTYIKKYLDMGADINGNTEVNNFPDEYANSPLFLALASDKIDAGEYLILRGADVNKPQGLIVEVAQTDANSYYHENEYNKNYQNEKPKMLGVNCLLKYRANVNVISIHGESVVESILRYIDGFHIIIIDFLLENGANINMKNSKSKTPLDASIELGQKNCITYLISKGAKTSDELNSSNNSLS